MKNPNDHSYTIVTGRIRPSDPEVQGVKLSADALIDGADDPRYPAPDGYEWGEGIVIDDLQFVELIPKTMGGKLERLSGDDRLPASMIRSLKDSPYCIHGNDFANRLRYECCG